MPAPTQESGIQLQPHQEHEEEYAILAEYFEGGKDCWREESCCRLRRYPAEKRGTQKNARDDLTDNLWLLEATKYYPQQPRDADDDSNLYRKEQEHFFQRHGELLCGSHAKNLGGSK